MYCAELLLLLDFLSLIDIIVGTSALHELRLDCLLSLMGEHILNPCFAFDLLLGLETRYVDVILYFYSLRIFRALVATLEH